MLRAQQGFEIEGSGLKGLGFRIYGLRCKKG
jgi:hypothetical protein